MDWTIILLFFLALAISGLVLRHSRHTTYKCPKCSRKFKISFLRDLLSPHWPTRKGGVAYLKCPKCKNYIKAREAR